MKIELHKKIRGGFKNF